ncbi:MAG TPA: DUF6600 domain-containing protein [Rhizomicrobium sp.]|jgi:hypothetical protein
MRKTLSSALCATAILLCGTSTIVLAPTAQAQMHASIGFNFFHDRLAAHGQWIHHPVWGDVWRPKPRIVGADFQPYTNGHWEYTDEYGWYWVSADPFDDVVYHYGRWVYDPQYRWLWVPGYTWAPAWVVWREGDDYTGWMPMPPTESFLSGAGVSFGVDLGPVGVNFYRNFYGSRVDPDDFYVFVGNGHLVDRDYRRFVVPRDQRKVIIDRTRSVTKFEVVNNRVVNRGVDVKIVERAAGHRIAPVSAKTVIKPGAVITTVDEGKQVRERERAQHPVNTEAFRKARAGGGAANEPGAGNEKGGAGAEQNPGSRKANGNAPGGENGPAGANPAAGNAGEGAGAMGEGTGKRNRRHNEETTPPSGAAGAGQSGETTNPAPGETPKHGRSRSQAGESSNGNGAMEPGAGNEAGAPAASSAETPPAGGHHRKSGAASGATDQGAGNPGAMTSPGMASPDQTGAAPGARKRNRAVEPGTSPSGASGTATPGAATPDRSPRMRNPSGEAVNPAGAAPQANGSSDANQPKKKKKHGDENTPPSGSPD